MGAFASRRREDAEALDGVEQGVPAKFAWTAAFGLVVTLVWMYLEFLRLIAIFRGN